MADLNVSRIIERPPVRLYEVRTVHGDAYRAEGDVIESGDGWFTLWADEMALALRVPEADIRAVRQVYPDEPASAAPDSRTADLVKHAIGIDLTESEITPDYQQLLVIACRELLNSENARAKLRADRERQEEQLADARSWARHGYEIGQRHCSWSDYGVAPAWLTEGWPRSFDSCEHLQQAAEFDEALTRMRNLSTEPEAMNADQPSPEVWKHGYQCGVLAAKSAIRPRNEKTVKP